MAAMINDMIYSQEQQLLHHYEGFPCNSGTTALVPAGGIGGLPGQMKYLYHGAPGSMVTQLGDVGWWRVGND